MPQTYSFIPHSSFNPDPSVILVTGWGGEGGGEGVTGEGVTGVTTEYRVAG